MEVTVNNKTFFISTVLKNNLDQIKKAVYNDFDCVATIEGMEGSAKSTFAQMIGYYLCEGKNFSVKNIVFSVEDFIDFVDNAPPNSTVIFDEMVLGGLSTEVLGRMSKILTKKFTLIRKKRLFIIMVIPYCFMLTKYLIMGRTRFLIHCYTRPDKKLGLKRGFFKFYNGTQKNYYYIRGIKYWVAPKDCPYSFSDTFSNYTGMFLDKEEYEKKKDEATKDIGKEGDDDELMKKEIKRAVPPPRLREILTEELNWNELLGGKTTTDYDYMMKYIRYLKKYHNLLARDKKLDRSLSNVEIKTEPLTKKDYIVPQGDNLNLIDER